MPASVRPAIPADVLTLARCLRPADLQELAALGTAPHKALHQGLSFSSPHAFAVHDTETWEPLAMFGVVPGVHAAGIWLLGTEKLVSEYKWDFLHHSRAWVEKLNTWFPRLTNIVDTRNTVHRKWLEWCGFKFLNEIQVGPDQIPFIAFERLQE